MSKSVEARKKFSTKVCAATFVGIFILCCLSSPLYAERLSLKPFSTADGLANDNVNKIFADSRGFLWFCTGEGLSRFDGARFKNYTQDQGLPHRNVLDFLETKTGDYLIATTGGLAAFNPDGKAYRWDIIEGKLEQTSDAPPLFRNFLTPDAQENSKISKAIMSLAEDARGNIFAGTNHGLFRVVKSAGQWRLEKIEFAEWQKVPMNFNFLFADSKKNLWIATSHAVYLMSETGAIKKINESGGNSVFETRDGKVWVDSGGNEIGIRIYVYENGSPTPVLTGTYTTKDGLPANGFTNAVAETADGRTFVSSNGKLLEFLPGARENEPKFRSLGNAAGSAAADNSGNIWFNVPGKGAARFTPNSFTVYDERDGIPNLFVSSIFGNRKGEVFFTFGKNEIVGFTDGKPESVVPFGLTNRLWEDTYLDFQSADGEWWITSAGGLRRYPKLDNFKHLAKTPPKRVYTVADGLFSDSVFSLFEDSRGDIWISAPDAANTLNRWERATDKIYRYTTADNLPSGSGAVSFGEDAAGNIWVGFFFGQIIRYKDGKFRSFTDEGLLPQGNVSKMLRDQKGRLWLATSSRGLFRVDEPHAETPAFVNYSTAEGLSSNQALCLAEDEFGRLYVGTGRGLTRLEPETGKIKIYTQADGLPGNTISSCYRDANGVLWFGSNNSLIRFSPPAEQSAANPPVFIEGVSVNGAERRVSELGASEIKNLDFAPDENRIRIGFFAISFDSGEQLKFQYKLDEQDWSAPFTQRSVEFNLTPGTYNFAVRAVNSDGVVSEKPATVAFTIQPPIYQRWWFIALAALAIAALIFALDRYRVAKTRQVEAALEETRRAGKIIRESEIRYRTLAETASDAIITIDAQSKIIYINEAAENIFGYKSAELLGKPLVALMPERYRRMHEAGINRYLDSQKRHIEWSAVELQGLHKSGAEVPIELSFGEFEKDGEKFFTGIARDISERKKSEAALQKAREERLAELQRVRSRIATDLHDDIGSSLTQISVYSELARQRERENGKAGEPLDMISNVADELVETMSDIVWAINPKKDHLQDLTQRMRRFAANVLTAKDIEMTFRAPEADHEIPLGANIRREVFLIFKETVNNIVKHSEATEAEIVFATADHFLTINFRDNGKGFDQNGKTEDNVHHDWKRFRGGNGLLNMKKRARDLGGSYEIESETGRGTTVVLKVPLEI